jgi:RsiW-degrading membrane proteinase PrsW (M82 family)
MYLFLLLVVSVVPGLLWLYYFYRQDRFDPEPKGLVLKLFFGSMLLVFPAGFIELLWRTPLTIARATADLAALFIFSFLLIGLVEEGVKFLFLLATIYRRQELNEPVDGIIYGVTTGLGFAVLENLFYTQAMGFRVGLLRAVVACLAHAAFTGWGGLFLTKAKKSSAPLPALFTGLAVAVFWHGLYDFLLFTNHPVMTLLAFLVIGVLILKLSEKIRGLVKNSPFRT